MPGHGSSGTKLPLSLYVNGRDFISVLSYAVVGQVFFRTWIEE